MTMFRSPHATQETDPCREAGRHSSRRDETGLHSDESRHRGYAPRGRTPVLRTPARRKSQSLISAITNQGKVRFME
jgi:hypothetical protein